MTFTVRIAAASVALFEIALRGGARDDAENDDDQKSDGDHRQSDPDAGGEAALFGRRSCERSDRILRWRMVMSVFISVLMLAPEFLARLLAPGLSLRRPCSRAKTAGTKISVATVAQEGRR